MPSPTKTTQSIQVVSYTLKSQYDVQKTQFVHMKSNRAVPKDKHCLKHFTATCVQKCQTTYSH